MTRYEIDQSDYHEQRSKEFLNSMGMIPEKMIIDMTSQQVQDIQNHDKIKGQQDDLERQKEIIMLKERKDFLDAQVRNNSNWVKDMSQFFT